MNKTQQLIARAAATALAIAGITAIAAPAEAAKTDCNTANAFCAWNNSQYTGMFLETAYTGNATVDMADNMMSAGWNKQSRVWCAVDSVGGNTIVYRFAATTSVGYVGDTANDKADFMWPKGAGTC